MSTEKNYLLKKDVFTHGPQCNPIKKGSVIHADTRQTLLDADNEITEDDFEETDKPISMNAYKSMSYEQAVKKLAKSFPDVEIPKNATTDDLIGLIERLENPIS